MTKLDYTKRLESLRNRRHGDELIKKAMFGEYEIVTESYEVLKESLGVKYAIGAMQPVDEEYTENTFLEGERVLNQLRKLEEKGYEVEFKYQGSVTNNTHIKSHSDIDILVLHCGFFSLEPPQIPANPYKGDPIQDLSGLREESYEILKSSFPAVDIDNDGAKCINLKGGSLRREVDVVPSNWFDTVKYTETRLEYYRGVMILDNIKKERLTNTPFFHNKLLNDKDSQTAFNYKKMVRLLKTLKADADVTIKLSSYDIAALLYHMDNSAYLVGSSPLRLIEKSLHYLKDICTNEALRNSLHVPDESRSIFQDKGATVKDLKMLTSELVDLHDDIVIDLQKSGSTIFKEIVA